MPSHRTKIALLGADVSQSPSPVMHNQGFRHLGLPFSYQAISVKPEEFESTFLNCRAEFHGLNITIPYKEIAVRLLEELSPRTRKLGAVNTVLFANGYGKGENTDVDGLGQAVRESGFRLPANGMAFLLGGGGAAKASLEALSLLGVTRFAVSSRTTKRMEQFQAWARAHYPPGLQVDRVPFHLDSWNQALRGASLFLNAAPLEACKEIPFFSEIQFRDPMLVVDWVHTPVLTPWLKKGKSAGSSLVYGYKILLYQGIKAFEFWTGRQAPAAEMEKALRGEIR